MSRTGLLLVAAAVVLAATPVKTENLLLEKWTGPYGGVPPFDKAKVADFKPALEAAMAENLKEIDAIAKNPAKPDFDNTIAAFERAGKPYERATAIYRVFSSTMSTDDFQKVETEMAPKIAAFNDQIVQNKELFSRIAAVYDAREASGLTPEQKRLVWLDYTTFVRAGARLEGAARQRMTEINQRLASLFTKFSQNHLGDEKDYVLYLEKESDLAGLPGGVRAGAAAAAEARGHKGQWAILNTRSSMEPFLTYSDRRDLREKVWRTYYSRCNNGDAKDNNATISEILKLRAERANLLGYATHAHWRLEDTMAKTPERAMELMEAVWKPAVARVHEEVADMQGVADAEAAQGGQTVKIEPWDYRYYAEKVRKARYDLDQNAVTPYLQLEKMREAIFWNAGRLFGLQFKPAAGVPVVHPDIRVWEVTDAAGRHVGLWYFDPYARPGKESGAWMSAYRHQSKFDGVVTTIVSNNANFVKGRPGEPVLISWDDATTMFHEFGHALHGLSSNVSYPTLAGTSVKRDFVELPSMLNEHWLPTPEVLNRFALHYRTGKPIPPELVAKIEKAKNFNQGFSTVEYLAGAIYDMKIHLAATPDQTLDAGAFEQQTMDEIGCPSEIVMRHRPTHFGHMFSSDGYSAGYYVYLWADTLTADACDAFNDAGSLYDKSVAKRYYETILSVGNSVPPDEAFRRFRGRDVDTDALMRGRGFPVTKI